MKEGQSHALERLPSLDGWRALSILLVLGGHCRFVHGHPGFFDIHLVQVFINGDLGVRCFFTISGLLITWLLLVEHDRDGHISLRHFYLRRALRILPVYFAYLGVLGCLAWLTPFSQTRANWIANLTFTTNYVPSSWCSGHLWSLAVEEQFYLLWPALLVVFALPSKPHLGLRVLCIPLVVAPVWRLINWMNWYPASLTPAFGIFSFCYYFDCLAFGCICAFLLKHHRALLEGWLARRPKAAAIAGVALILFPNLMSLAGVPLRLVMSSRFSFQACGMAILMLQSIISPQSCFYRLLNWKWVCHLGVLSYSIYIWQELFCTDPATFGLRSVWWMSFPGWVLSALVAAHLSYFLLERPLFRLRSRFR